MNKSRRIMAIMISTSIAFAAAGAPVSAASDMTKEETVYVVTDAGGKAEDVIVSDHIINDMEADRIDDRSDLTHIENVKGDETFTRGKGSQIIWRSEGNDIFYEGKTSKELPVKMDITYKLDGKDVKGPQLEGKSGEVEIKIDFSDNAKASAGGGEVTVPFLAVVGFIAGDESFTDIKIDSGKVIDDGDKKMVVGMAAPGLSDALDIDLEEYDIDIKDSVTITGKAKKFDIQDMMTLVTNSVFDDIDTEDLGLDMDDDIGELDKAGRALVDGTDSLYKGINTLYGNMPALEEGVGKLKEGSEQLSDGTDKARAGSEDLVKGTKKLRSSLNTQMSDMKSGTSQLRDGSKKVLDGMNALKTGLDKGDGTEANPGAIPALNGIGTGLGQVSAGLSSTSDGINSINSSLTAAKAGASDVNDYLNDLKEAYDGLTDIQKAKVEETIGSGLINRLTGNSGVISESAQVKGVLDTVTGDSGLSKVDQAVNQSRAGVESAKDGVDEVKKGLENASSSLGAYDPSLGTDQKTLIGGQTVVYNGLDVLYEKLEKATGKKGELTLGLDSLVSGTTSLRDGEVTLSGGAKELAEGMSRLEDNTGKLSSGVTALDRGSLKLSQGMSRFYQEGIRKLVEMYEGELKGSVDGLKNAVDAGQEYRIFTELGEGMDGSVKFIYKTRIY